MSGIKCADFQDVLILKQWRNVFKIGKWGAIAKSNGALNEIDVKIHSTIFVVYATGP